MASQETPKIGVSVSPDRSTVLRWRRRVELSASFGAFVDDRVGDPPGWPPEPPTVFYLPARERNREMRRPDRSRSSRWRTVAFVGAVLFVGSMTPSPFRGELRFGAFGPDKMLHLLGHAGFSSVLADTLADEGVSGRNAAVVAVAASTGYGAAMDVLQRWVPGRAPERADVVAALLGSVLGVLGWRYAAGGTPVLRSRRLGLTDR